MQQQQQKQQQFKSTLNVLSLCVSAVVIPPFGLHATLPSQGFPPPYFEWNSTRYEEQWDDFRSFESKML